MVFYLVAGSMFAMSAVRNMTLYKYVTVKPILNSSIHATCLFAFFLFYSIEYGLRCIGYESKSGRDAYALLRFRNYSISVIHAFFSGFSSLICLSIYPDLINDIVGSENQFAYHILGFATGYFLHDIYHNIVGGICLRSLEIIIHHIIVVLCFCVVSTYRILVCYALLGLLMELNSIFLHGRQVMLFLNILPDSLIYKMNAVANIVTFIIFRILLTLALFYWAIINRSRMPTLVSTILLTSFTVLTTMNIILFMRVLSSERRVLESSSCMSKSLANGKALKE